MILSGASAPGQSGPGSDGTIGVLAIPQSPSSTGASPSDILVLYLGYSLIESYSSAEMQPVYSPVPSDLTRNHLRCKYLINYIVKVKESKQAEC